MSFFSVLFALLLEQARPLKSTNSVHAALRAWVRWSSRCFDAGKSHHGWLAWGFAVCGPFIASWLIYWLLDTFVGWPVAVLWSVAVLYVTLGFRQFSFHFTLIRDALADRDENRARELLAEWQQIDASSLPRGEIVRHVIEYSVLSAHRHVFGVLTWFSVLAVFGFGPAGAVFYRLGEFVVRYWQHKNTAHHQPVSDSLQETAKSAWAIIDWVPARLTAISFAVVGSFEDAIDGWRNYSSSGFDDNDGIILAATAGAVNIKLESPPRSSDAHEGKNSYLSLDASQVQADSAATQLPTLAHLAVIVGLVWRTVVMWMVLLALLTLARLLG
jgi:adenosylcobinamide-phosphate synthase